MSPRKAPPSAADLHRQWLELVDADGPFLSVPALKRVWPQGMPQPRHNERAVLRDARPSFEKAWDAWDTNRDDAETLDAYRRARDAWVDLVLREVIGWKASYVTGADAGAGTSTGVLATEVRSPDRSVTVRPTGALIHGSTTGALVLVTDPVDSLRDALADGWAASPVDRMEQLLRASGVLVGVVTDGRWWAIVSARPETMLASGVTDAQTWTEAPATRDAFIELLRRPRLVAGKPEDRLTELFKDSVAAAEVITEALGTQVRRAVELLVQALSKAALNVTRHGEPDPLPADRDQVYAAAVTVMMRVVFLLFAEERGLLPTSSLFTEGYGISDELDKLDDRLHEESSESLDATEDTWHRLLATSQALYRGAPFEDAQIPSYGGSLFDPARFGFLTARGAYGKLTVAVSDRVMLEVLRAVQMARLPGEPARRISFRDIDVEQIGYIYEGLLGYSCKDADEVTVGLIGKEGEEPEIPLAKLEELAAAKKTDTALADAIIAWAKADQPAAVSPSKATLAKAIRGGAEVEDADRALRLITTDETLRARLRPFIGIIRRDLRGRPTVVLPGGVLVVETPSRATAGAHYTPKSLAEDVVRYALEPLVYSPGPHQKANPEEWVPLKSDQITELKVADIACGSGAFLVAAARYLGDRLAEAWTRQRETAGMSPGQLRLHAIRTVIAKCLYGADINAMAVEMCKLSLWLVSLDPKLPFSFVDDKILHGNALLGLTDTGQLKHQHVYPQARTQISMDDFDVDTVLKEATRIRKRLASEVNDSDPERSTDAKRRLLRDYQALTAPLAEIADGIVAAGLKLGGKPGKQLNAAYENLAIAIGKAHDPYEPNRSMLDAILDAGLTPTVLTDYARWKPLHWVLAVPDVMEHGGFDAIVGNPPFLGGKKVSVAVGSNLREWLVNIVAHGNKGNADLVANFLLRAFSLLTPSGNLGLIATNSVAQGDTREVGLDQLEANGFTITRAIQSRPWPVKTANLEYAAFWGARGPVVDTLVKVADDARAPYGITTLLEAAGRVAGRPARLNQNRSIAFIGSYVNCIDEFSMPTEVASRMILDDDDLRTVIRPLLGGEDLNQRPACDAPQWIVDFTGLTEDEAKRFGPAYDWALRRVRPARLRLTNKPRQQQQWWLYERPGIAMRIAIAGMPEIIAITLVSKAVMPVRVSADQVFSHLLGLFATSSFVDQAVLSSSMHQLWSIKYGSTLETRVRYAPTDVFETFPRPKPTDQLTEIGRTLDTERREIMLRRDLGLTKLYNLVNDPDIADTADPDIARMREIHVELDHAVMDAYGWGDVQLDHGFHTYRRMTRWSISPAARVELFDRLLEENHRRAAAQGEAPPPADDDEDGDDE